MREAIKDEDLADEAEAIESAGADPAQSRKAMREAIERKHTATAAKAE